MTDTREKLLRWTGFLVLWGLVGFALGTATLMGPVRWVANVVRWLGVTETVESLAVNGIIAGFVLASFGITWILGRWIRESGSAWVRFGVPSLAAVLAVASLWMWLTPGMMATAGAPPRAPEAPFTIGPYPDDLRMRQLQAAGYTGVVSLLHPAVVPFEPKLLADEREAARREGLEFIHAPMLPWVSSNEEALETLRTLARRDTGYYYIHCYLGRDRVRVAARALREMGVEVTSWEGEEPESEYSLFRRDSLYRGAVHVLPDSIAVVPFPDREEYFTYILNGGIRSVVSLLDPSVEDDRRMIQREEEWLAALDLDIEYRHHPTPLFPADPCRLRALADSIRALPRPVAVHGADTESHRSRSMLHALQGEPVDPGDFARGIVHYAGDSIYVGPAPTDEEIAGSLTAGGLGSVVSVLDPSDSAQAEELVRIREGLEGTEGLTFLSLPLAGDAASYAPDVRNAASWIQELPGPVYVHGDRTAEPRMEALRQALSEAGVAPRCELPSAGGV